jgi:hypothetical protein
MRHLAAADTYTQAGDWLFGTARRNPEALLLVAAGCCLLMRSGSNWNKERESPSRDRQSERYSYQVGSSYSLQRTSPEGTSPQGTPSQSTVSSVRKAASQAAATAAEATDTASEYVSNMTQRVTDAASNYAGTVSRYTHEAGRSLYAQSRQAQSTVQETIGNIVREQSLAIAAAGLAVGAAIAAIFPSTRIESRTFGGTRDALTEAASKAGENLMGAATEAGERFVSAANQRGLSSEGLKNLAGEVAESFSNALTGGNKGERASPSIAPQSPGTGSGMPSSNMAPAGSEPSGSNEP